MGTIVIKDQPCLKCTSHDARQIYDDGTSYCFSCNKFFRKDHNEEEVVTVKAKDIFKEKYDLSEIVEYGSRGFEERKIEKAVSEFYGVKVSYNSDGEIDTHYYPYNKNTGFKVRKLPKKFSAVGDINGLFGRDLFNGGNKRLVITEGELDAMSVAQSNYDKYNKFYPVVSVPSASNLKPLIENRDWIRSFGEVVIFFDNDKAGEEALNKAIKIIGVDKVKIAKPPAGCKDASDVLMKHGYERLINVVWDAARWEPPGILTKEALWKAFEEYSTAVSVPYPHCLDGVNSKLKGMRLGEITLFISGTGSGKSTVVREIILHILNTTEDKVGLISLEESPAETVRVFSCMALNLDVSDDTIPNEKIREGFEQVFGEDRLIVLDHQNNVKDNTLIDRLEYLCLIGCKYLFIDHITILVSEGSDGLTGNEAIDKTMNDLLRVTKRHNVWTGLVSHLRKTQGGGRSFEEGKLPSIDDIKGSGSIKQVSFDIIAFARDMTSEDEVEQNTIKMAVLKARKTGRTGPVKGVFYDRRISRLIPLDEMPADSFDIA